MPYQLLSLSGLLIMIGLAWLCSTDRRAVSWTLVARGVALQFLFALLVLRTGPGEQFFRAADGAMRFVLNASEQGTGFVFGALADQEVFGKAMGDRQQFGFVFAVQVTGTIILVSALMSGLYYIGVMQWVVYAIARIMQLVLGTSGAESLAAAANVFAGQTEAPLVIKPYLQTMTPSELTALMTGGMTTIAGGVMAAYVGLLEGQIQNVAGHLLAASVMSAPASLVIAKIMVPETAVPQTHGTVRVQIPREGRNLLDAICHGAADGLKLSLNVMAMLIAFIALVALANALLESIGLMFGVQGLSFQLILGRLCAPIALAMGVPWAEAVQVGTLLAERNILNEFVAYVHLEQQQLSDRSEVIATYALCGFANFSSIAIQIGGIGSLVPSRRQDLSRLGLRAMIGGTLACFMTATIAGALWKE